MRWHFSVWIVTSLMVLATPQWVGALATVESRTGEPVFFSGEPAVHAASSSTARSAMPSGTLEDRAALLSMKHLESLKQEVSELRGLVETQAYEIQQLKKSQQDFYTDLDKRINQLQSSKPASKTAAKTTVVVPTAKGKSSITIVPTGKSSVTTPVTKDEPIITEHESRLEESSTMDVVPTQVGNKIKTTTTTSEANEIKANHTNEKAAYEAAYDLIRTKRYSEAITAFQNYLAEFKEGEHAANAHYWMGEVYMVEWQKDSQNKNLLDKAALAFSSVASQFPKNPRVPDALLKLGIVENEKGNVVSARKYFTDVKNRYPGSAAARIAETRLKQL